MKNTEEFERCKTHYKVLGVSKTATLKEIRKAYKDLSLMYHPDKNPSADCVGAFSIISLAHEILSDAQLRKEYDTKYVNIKINTRRNNLFQQVSLMNLNQFLQERTNLEKGNLRNYKNKILTERSNRKTSSKA